MSVNGKFEVYYFQLKYNCSKDGYFPYKWKKYEYKTKEGQTLVFKSWLRSNCSECSTDKENGPMNSLQIIIKFNNYDYKCQQKN